MLNDYLKETKVKRHLLCHSLAGNKVEYLHITNKQQSKSEPTEDDKKRNEKQKKEQKSKKQEQNKVIEK